MDKFNGFKDKGVVAQHVARAEEMLNNYNLTIDLLEQIDTSAPARADYDDRGTGKLGIGVIEGPGVLMYTWLMLKIVKSNSIQLLYQLLGIFQQWDQLLKVSIINMVQMLSELTTHVYHVQLT